MILLSHWVGENISELKKICKHISRQNDVDDLLQVCLEQLLKNKKIHDIPDTQKIYFFARIVRNQFYSDSSKYHLLYRKINFIEFNPEIEVKCEEYEEPILTLEWVFEQVEIIKKHDWYLGQIFLLWLSREANLTKLSKDTGIPINNLSRDIRQVKSILNKLYKQKLK